MAAIYSNGGNRWNILGFNFTKRDALSSVYKISMTYVLEVRQYTYNVGTWNSCYMRTYILLVPHHLSKLWYSKPYMCKSDMSRHET